MGNIPSGPGTTPITTLPIQKTPVPEGASGLHYSGRVYTNQLQQLGANICDGGMVEFNKIDEVMPNSISTTTLPIDDTTKRISASALAGYVGQLQATGLIPGQMPTFDEQLKADKAFYAAVQSEYCFYESRYLTALTLFLGRVSDQRGADPNSVTASLNQTIALNQRLNSLLEIIGYVGNDRAQKVNDRSTKIEQANADLASKIKRLDDQREYLQSSDVRIRTQEEMMRFSAEKSRAMNIQIMFFVALNVIALGTVLTVYRSSSGV